MDKRKNIAIIGVGLIGGSLALQLKEKGLVNQIMGVDHSPVHQQKALALGLVDRMGDLDQAVAESEVIILAIPVDSIVKVLPELLAKIDHQIVIDMGSTKASLVEQVNGLAKRGRYVATHPMWGTEYSGPEAAVKGAFENKAVVICDAKDSDADAIEWTRNMYREIGMHLIEMTAHDHDLHAAYVSHISHITSFALANTVLEKEREDKAIFEMASGGFESTVRLAKSNPDMWVPILMQNKENVLDVLNEHISQLRKFKSCLEKENVEYLKELMDGANRIKRIIK